MKITTPWKLVKTTFSEFVEDDALTLGGALAFYTALSLAPILVIVLAVAGWIWGDQAEAQQQFTQQLEQVVGEQSAQVIQGILVQSKRSHSTGIAAAFGVIMLLISATGVFSQLQYSLNTIWHVDARPGNSIWNFIRKRLLTMGMILGIGLLLLLSLAISTAVHTAIGHVQIDLPGLSTFWQVLNVLISMLIFALLFAMIFKILPDGRLPWRDAWVGAGITAVLFLIGKELIGLYLSYSSVGSAYGVAGSLVIFLVWIYYSSLIFFVGAEFTQVYAHHRGARVVPDEHAVVVGEQPEESGPQTGL